MIRITSKHDGFMRGGVRHPAAPTEYPDDHFSEEALAAIEAEPMLVVEHLLNKKSEEKKTTKK